MFPYHPDYNQFNVSFANATLNVNDFSSISLNAEYPEELNSDIFDTAKMITYCF